MSQQKKRVDFPEISPGAIGDRTRLKVESKSWLDPKSELLVALVFLMAIAIGIALVFGTGNAGHQTDENYLEASLF